LRGDIADLLEVDLHAIAVKLRQEQPAPIQMGRFVHREDGGAARNRSKHRCIRFSCMNDVGRRGEHRLQKGGRPDGAHDVRSGQPPSRFTRFAHQAAHTWRSWNDVTPVSALLAAS
jgi:hypothetical protein